VSHTTQVPDSEFLDLIDTPSSYSGQTLKGFRVNAAEDGIEFIDLPSGSSYVSLAGDTMTGALGVPNGLVSAAGLYFGGDVDTGLYYEPSERTIKMTEAGSTIMQIPGNLIVPLSIGGNGTNSNNSISIGFNALHHNNSEKNVGIGASAGLDSVRWDSVWIGYQAGRSGTGGAQNFIGSHAGHDSIGNNVIGMGYDAGRGSTSSSSVFLGHSAGYYCTGAEVTALGFTAGGTASSGDYCVYLGHGQGSGATVDNQFLVGHSTVNATPLIQGNFSTGDINVAGIIGAERFADIDDLDAFLQWGAGTPEGSIAAGPGSLYGDVTNGVLYIKKTGVSSTGWSGSALSADYVEITGDNMTGHLGFGNADYLKFGTIASYLFGYDGSTLVLAADGSNPATNKVFSINTSGDLALYSSTVSFETGSTAMFMDGIPIYFGSGQDITLGYHAASDQLQVVDGSTLDSNVYLSFHSTDGVRFEDYHAIINDDKKLYFGTDLDTYIMYGSGKDRLDFVHGTTTAFSILNTAAVEFKVETFIGDDIAFAYGSDKDFYAGYSNTAGEFQIGTGATVNTAKVISIDASGDTTIANTLTAVDQVEKYSVRESTAVTLVDNTATAIMKIVDPGSYPWADGGCVRYVIEVKDATDATCISGRLEYSAAMRSAILYDFNTIDAVSKYVKSETSGAKTVTVTWDFTMATGPNLRVNVDAGGLWSTPVIKIRWWADHADPARTLQDA